MLTAFGDTISRQHLLISKLSLDHYNLIMIPTSYLITVHSGNDDNE